MMMVMEELLEQLQIIFSQKTLQVPSLNSIRFQLQLVVIEMGIMIF